MDTKSLLVYVAIGVFIYLVFFRKMEFFGSDAQSSGAQCSYVKGQQKAIKQLYKKECSNLNDNADNRTNINERADCYNYAGQDIVTEIDANSWCGLDPKEQDIIEAATREITQGPANVNSFLQDTNLTAYDDDITYADFK